MARLCVWALLLVMVSACASPPKAPQQPLSPLAFREAYVQRFEQTVQDLQLRVLDDMELELRTESGGSFSVFLTNAYIEYSQDPSRLEAVLDAYIGSTSETVRQEVDVQLQPKHVMAVIKSPAYVADVNAQLQVQAGDDKSLYTQALNPELLMLLVQDNEHSVRFLDKATVASLGLDDAQLRALAIANLSRRVGGVQTQHNDGLYVLRLDGFYEASLLLIGPLWSSPALKVAGELVVAVPARDVLMVGGSDSAKLAFMRSTAESVARQSAYGISPALFVRRDGRWQLLND